MDSTPIKIIKKNEKVLILNPENSHWVKMSRKIYDKYSVNWSSFSDYLDREFSLFSKNTRKDSIRSVYYSVTGKCNLNCDFCSMSSGSGVSTKNDFSLEEIRQVVIPKIREVDPKTIVITGGEPFVRKDITAILQAFKEVFGKENILLQTNGILLSKQKIQEATQYVGAIEISIENIFDNELTLQKMKQKFNDIVAHGCGLKFSFVINPYTSQYLSEALRLTYEYDAACLLRFVSEVGRAATGNTTMSYTDKIDIYVDMLSFVLEKGLLSDNIAEVFLSSVQAKSECGAYGRTWGIHPDGGIFMCSNFQTDDFKLGNIREAGAKQLINNLNVKKEDENIKSVFLVNRREKCNDCDIQYFCTGPCAAEIIEKEKKEEDIYSDCDLKKLFVNFMLYEFDRVKTKQENLVLLLEYLKKERMIMA
ncbi:SPASM domain-containing protein [Paenibacillus albidus]|uniref:radical SAM/SPASM domain-containing protein n=1 Tax=Paenibacillus albidus TaxID=2041023 RepID=UPI001BE9F00B|nr:radical SAM protein [Paenibacillus albidus]MBT2292013.1 SPASM domain-containing protein [Paenibacillus albidus]